jgi:hypothetical protein
MEYSIQDIIDGAVENEPTKVQAAFDGVIGPRVLAALEARKREIASSMFASQQETEVEQENNAEVSNDENTEPATENN